MRRMINFTSSDARPEDIKGTIGVSDRFSDPELKKAVQESIQNTTQSEAVLAPEKDTSVESVLESIAGSSGSYQKIPRSELIATPAEWNQFSSISREKKILMAESIYRNGLQQPIVVRKLSDHEYQILAGNTRNEIFGILYDLTGNDFYLSIDAKVYDINELSDDQAREIASDTNYVQRAELSARDKAFAIHTKIEMLRKHKATYVLDRVAEQMNIKRTTVFYWNKLVTLIPEFTQYFDEGKIRLKTASKLAGWPEEIQYELWKRRDVLTDKIVQKISPRTIFRDVPAVFDRLVEELTAAPKRLGKVTSIHSDDQYHYQVCIEGTLSEDKDMVVLYLPKDKLKAFEKRYHDYILE